MTPEQRKEYYIKNREARLAYQKRYYELYKDAINEKVLERRRKDPNWLSRQKKYNKEYYLKNKERIKKQRKARVSADLEVSEKKSG
jgi:hypothetical protein